MLGSLLDWWFRDRTTGRLVAVQTPNVPILLWMGTVVARWFVDRDTSGYTALEWAGSLTLGWWAIDELVRGVNPFRRSLGLVGVVVVVLGIADRLT